MIELNKIYCGDCLEVMKQIPDKSIDLTVTSPPYDNLRRYNWFSWDFEWVAKELYRITKQGGVVVWIVWDATIKGSETGTSFKQALYFKEIGFNLHDTMIWKKSNPFNFGSNNCYIQSFEYMFIFSKWKPKSLNLIYDRENSTFTEWNTFAWNARDTKSDNKKTIKDRLRSFDKLWKRHNVWRMPWSTKYKSHSATFPEKLAEDHILSWSNEWDIILDPFMWSWTTAKMALINNRNYIWFEISQEYVDIAKKRIEEA